MSLSALLTAGRSRLSRLASVAQAWSRAALAPEPCAPLAPIARNGRLFFHVGNGTFVDEGGRRVRDGDICRELAAAEAMFRGDVLRA